MQLVRGFRKPTSTFARIAKRRSMVPSFIDPECEPSSLAADIILFCDEDASLFKAIVKHHSLEVDAMIAEELGYLNLHHRRRTDSGLVVNYLEFVFFSRAEGRIYRITRFDTLEDAARFLLSEPYNQRGAIVVRPASDCSSTVDGVDEIEVETAKHLVRTTLGFGCAAVLFNEASTIFSQDTTSDKADKAMDFSENGIVDRSMITRIQCSTKSMLSAKRGGCPKSKAWWCPSPVEQLQSLLSFFHSRLPQHNSSDGMYYSCEPMRTRHLSKVLTARFYCFDEKEGGSRITAMDDLKISIAGNMVVEGHVMDSPGLAIEPGKLCQSNVLVMLDKPVAADSRDQFVVRRMDGASVGVGMIVSCS